VKQDLFKNELSAIHIVISSAH